MAIIDSFVWLDGPDAAFAKKRGAVTGAAFGSMIKGDAGLRPAGVTPIGGRKFAESERLEDGLTGAPSIAEMRAHLEQVVRSPPFERSPRMQRLLRHCCEETFGGRETLLKEYALAVAVFDKPESFDPGTSATIRVELGRLRRLLQQYHVDHGQADALKLTVPKGSYIPRFERQVMTHNQGEAADGHPLDEDAFLRTGEWRLVTVMSCSFGTRDQSEEPDAAFLAQYDAFYTQFVLMVERHGGATDPSSTDRLTAYFGWPTALEDACGRAMTAGLELIMVVSKEKDIEIGLAIATSRVITRTSAERAMILGKAPRLAARMLGQVPASGILVTEKTRKLSNTAFDTIPAGSIETGSGRSTLLWRLLGVRSTTRFRATHKALPSSLVGRREELSLLYSRWNLALLWEGQLIIVEGEAGIGKSRLSETAIAQLRPRGTQIRFQCSQHHENSALFPVIQMLRSALRMGPTADAEARIADFLGVLGLDRAMNQALLRSLVVQSEGVRPPLSSSEQKGKTLQLLVEILQKLAQRRPIILLIEDIHWADPTTVELIGLVAASSEKMRLLAIMTGRLGWQSRFTPLLTTTVLRLARLPKRDCHDMIDQIVGAAQFSPAARVTIAEKADGIPLFLEELTKLLLAQDPRVPWSSKVPESLDDLLASQLSHLGLARGIAQIATVIGRDFSAEILKAVSGDNSGRVDDALSQLLAAGILTGSRPDGHYAFRHALLRDAAYASILEVDRKELHYRVGTVLADAFPEVAAENPELVAGHMRDAGRVEESIPFWLDAGRKAAKRYELVEAATDFRNALYALATMSASRYRDERELEIQLELGTAVRNAEGYYAADLKVIYERALDLAERLGRADATIAGIYGLWTAAVGSGCWDRADDLARDFNRAIGVVEPSDQLEAEGMRVLGACAAFRGHFVSADSYFERATQIYDPALYGPSFGYDPGAASAAYLAWVRWHVGDVAEGRRAAERALSMADRLGHPATTSMVLSFLIFHAVCERDFAGIASYNGRLQSLCSESMCRFWLPFGNACMEWSLFHADGNIAHFHKLLSHTKAHSELYLKSCLHILAMDICAELNLENEGLLHADLAESFIGQHDERIWEAEYFRLKGKLHLTGDDGRTKARDLFRRAITIARQQGAVSLERRATTAMETS